MRRLIQNRFWLNMGWLLIALMSKIIWQNAVTASPSKDGARENAEPRAQYSLAIPPLQAIGRISAEEAAVLTDRLRSELEATEAFEITEQTVVKAALQSAGLLETGCSTVECGVQAGKLLSTQLVVNGSIRKVGQKFFVEVQMIHVNSGQVVQKVSDEFDGEIHQLQDFMRTVALKLVGRSIPMHPEPSTTLSDWFSVPFNVQFSTFDDVTIDGEPIPDLKVEQGGKEIRFRGSEELKKKLHYGYHQITAWIDGKKQDFYFWKGLKDLQYYQKENIGEGYALIIGVSKYGKGLLNLPEVETQAKKLGQILETNNFEVRYLLDTEQRVTRQVIDATISELNKQMNVQKDRLFFYYGGHGKAVKPAFGDSLAYLIVNNYDMNDLENTCLSMDDIFSGRYMKQIQAKHILFAIDACVASIGHRLSKLDQASIRQFMDLNLIYSLTNEPGRTIFTAGSGAQEAIDEKGKGGIFTTALINALQGDADLYFGDGNGVTIMNELETCLIEYVTSEARLKRWPQEPARFDFGKGQFVFFHNPIGQGTTPTREKR